MRKPICCSFCGKHASNALCLLEGPDGSLICDECIEAGMRQVAQFRREHGWGIDFIPEPTIPF